jgi:hypothetical protein
MTTLKQVSSAGEAIKALGGNVVVMRLTGANKTTVWWWKKKGRFPPKYYAVISPALRDAGFVGRPSIYGQVAETEAAE